MVTRKDPTSSETEHWTLNAELAYHDFAIHWNFANVDSEPSGFDNGSDDDIYKIPSTYRNVDSDNSDWAEDSSELVEGNYLNEEKVTAK